MTNMPTAEEFLKDKLSEIHEEDIFVDLLQKMFKVDVTEIIIEFAKLHVEKALKEASENAKIIDVGIDYSIIKWVADKDSILNSYPLENIK
jgi:hypothetical protein